MAGIADPEAFILAQTRCLPVSHVPSIRLQLADEATPLWLKTEEELGAIGLPGVREAAHLRQRGPPPTPGERNCVERDALHG